MSTQDGHHPHVATRNPEEGWKREECQLGLTTTVRNSRVGAQETSRQRWPKLWHPHLWACHQRKLYLEKDTCTPTFTAALVPRARPQKQPTGNPTQAWTNTMWYKHRGKAQPPEKEERMPPAATKKGLARTPGSQAGQPEEDQYHTVSLPGGSSTFFKSTH